MTERASERIPCLEDGFIGRIGRSGGTALVLPHENLETPVSTFVAAGICCIILLPYDRMAVVAESCGCIAGITAIALAHYVTYCHIAMWPRAIMVA